MSKSKIISQTPEEQKMNMVDVAELALPPNRIIAYLRNLKYVFGGQLLLNDTKITPRELEHHIIFSESTNLGGGANNAIPESRIIQSTIQEIIRLAKPKIASRYVDYLKYDQSIGDEPLHTYVQALRGNPPPAQDDNFEYDVSSIKQFIWSVKRKLRGLKVSYHLMPILHGKLGGTGKSTAVAALVSPLGPLADLTPDLSIFADDRKYHLFHDQYVLGFEEMAKAPKEEVSAMKRIITSPDVSYRPLYENKKLHATNISSFIGTCNVPFDEIIVDPTGARRFWVIYIDQTIDWESINSIDYVALWRSVDELDETPPILQHYAEIFKIQEATLRTKTPVEIFFEERCQAIEDYTDETCIRACDLFQNYRKWASENNFVYPITTTKFGRTITAIEGVKKVRKSFGLLYNIKVTPDETKSNK